MSAVPEMYYFPIAGRGELSRLICGVGGTDIDDVFPGLGFKKLPFCYFGSLPVMKHGSFALAQSGAIEKYCARTAPLFASLTPQQRAIDDMFCATKEDILQDPSGRAEKAFGVLEALVPADGFINGLPYPTVADLVLVDVLCSVVPWKKKMASVDTSKFPKILALVERTKAVPIVQQYITSTPTMRGSFGGVLGQVFKIKCCCRRSLTRRLKASSGQPAPKTGQPGQGGEPAVISTDQPEMFYFPIAGRGELARLIAAAGGLELKDTFPGQDYKDKVGFFGSMPTLKHGDLSMCQTGAIESYLAAVSPKFKDLDAQQRAIDDMYIHTKEDLLAGCAKVLSGDDAAKAKAAKQQTISKVFDRYLGPIENMVPAEGFVNKYAFPTAADLSMLNVWEATMPFGKARELAGVDLNAKYPKISQLVHRTKAVPGVAQYLKGTSSMTGVV